MKSFTIGELARANNPVKFADKFAEFIWTRNPLLDGVYCVPHYIARDYKYDFSHIPKISMSIFQMQDKLYKLPLSVRTYDEFVSAKFNYPLTPETFSTILESTSRTSEKTILKTHLNQKTYIYLIRDRDTGFIKIGRSVDPESRLKALIKQDTLMPKPNDFYLLNCWSDLCPTELVLHDEFKHKRMRGEWFDLSEYNIQQINRFFELRKPDVPRYRSCYNCDQHEQRDPYSYAAKVINGVYVCGECVEMGLDEELYADY